MATSVAEAGTYSRMKFWLLVVVGIVACGDSSAPVEGDLPIDARFN